MPRAERAPQFQRTQESSQANQLIETSLPQSNYQRRRRFTAWSIEKLWPYEIVEHEHNNSIEKIQQLAKQEYKFIFAHGHIFMADPFIASAFATRVSPEIAEGQIISPIAWHQRQFARIAQWNGARVYPIVTKHTVDRRKNFQNGKELPLNSGYRKYAVESGQALRESKGTTTVFVAPHGGRTSTPRGPAGPAVETIARFAQKSKIEQDQKEKVAIVLVGVSIRGVKKYQEGKTDRVNLRKKIVLEVDVLTLDEIQDQARLHGISLDEEVTNLINNLSYKTYLKPKQLRKAQSNTPSS